MFLYSSVLFFFYFSTFPFSDVKSVLHNASDDDGCPNTYDYNDSFIDDKTGQTVDDSENAISTVESSVGAATQDDALSEKEDIKELVAEAQSFLNNDKMTKT